MGRHKKNQSLIKSDNTILDKSLSIVEQIQNSDEISEAEKSFIVENLRVAGAMVLQQHKIKTVLAEINAEIKEISLVKKKKQLALTLKKVNAELSLTNNKITGYIEMLQGKIEAGELTSSSFLQLTGGGDEQIY